MSRSKFTSLIMVGITSLSLVFSSIPNYIGSASANDSQEQKSQEQKNGGGGEGHSEAERQKKLADDLQTLRGPARLRTNIIASAGLLVGGAIGEVTTTAVTCFFKCIPFVDLKINYQPGDVWRQTIEGQKKLWGVKTSSKSRSVSPAPNSPQTQKPTETETPKVTRKYGYENVQWVRHKYGFEYFQNRFGGITVGVGDPTNQKLGATLSVQYGGKIKVGDKILTASIDPTGKAYFKEE